MRPVAKEVVRFAIRAGPSAGPMLAEIRAASDGFGGWRASLALVAPDGSEPRPVLRTFRAPDRAAAIGKMVLWVRRRFPGARPSPTRIAAFGGRVFLPEGREEDHDGAGTETARHR